MFRYLRFQVLTATRMKKAVFWVVAPCSLVEVYRRFKGAWVKWENYSWPEERKNLDHSALDKPKYLIIYSTCSRSSTVR
jgi:hypothetical protein